MGPSRGSPYRCIASPFHLFQLYVPNFYRYFLLDKLLQGTKNATGFDAAPVFRQQSKRCLFSGCFRWGPLETMSMFLLPEDISGREFIIQDILDQIVPGILPLAVVMGAYWFYTKKGF